MAEEGALMQSNWIFEHTWALYLLILLPLIVWLRFSLWQYRQHQLELLGNSRIVAAIVVARDAVLYHSKTVALCCVWTFGVLALANPQGNPTVYPGSGVDQKANEDAFMPQEIILAIDASASMAVKDGRLQSTRLDNAKEIAELLLEQLQGEYAALYAFTAEATALAPPTLDYLFVILQLRRLRINEGDVAGTDFGQALSRIVYEATQRGLTMPHTVVWFSDGGDQALDTATQEGKDKLDQFLQEVEALRDKGWHFFSVGMGSQAGGTVPDVEYEGKPVTAVLEDKVLRSIAESGGGRYFAASETSSLELAKRLSQSFTADANKDVRQMVEQQQAMPYFIYTDYFQIPLAMALLALLMMLILPDVTWKKNS
jgi:hypothetical protein